MNRIVLIGNGFDIAHGFATKYTEFIDDYWLKQKNLISQGYGYYNYVDNKEYKIENIDSSILTIISSIEKVNPLKGTINSRDTLYIKNILLEIITRKSLLGWVDIENEYYQLLKKTISEINFRCNISDLNFCLSRLKELLEIYLSEIQVNNIDSFSDNNIKSKIGYKLFEDFKLIEFPEKIVNDYALKQFERLRPLRDFFNQNRKEEIENYKDLQALSWLNKNFTIQKIKEELLLESASNYFDLTPERVLLLNFNYTNTVKFYKNSDNFRTNTEGKKIEVLINNIHGEIGSKINPIIFGYGDELEEDYKK